MGVSKGRTAVRPHDGASVPTLLGAGGCVSLWMRIAGATTVTVSAVLGVTSAVFDFPSGSDAGIAFFFLLSLAAVTASTLYYARERISELEGVFQETESSDFGSVVLPHMGAAFAELHEVNLQAVRVLAYVGNYVARSLPDWPNEKENLRTPEFKMLVRNPQSSWRWPPDGSKQRGHRTVDFEQLQDALMNSSALSRMRHRTQLSPENPVRFAEGEPAVRVLHAVRGDRTSVMYVGFYPLKPRDEVDDFSGTEEPVIRIESEWSERLTKGFEEWFDCCWDLKSKRPLIALDYDEVIADTNLMKSQWIKDNLDRDWPPNKCSRTDSAKEIGEANYLKMGETVYGEAGSATAEPMAGVAEVLTRLSADWRFVVVTKRTPERAKYAEDWVAHHGLSEILADVRSSAASSKREVLSDLRASVLVDDDRGHLTTLESDGPVGILFHSDSKPGEDLPQVDSWVALERLLERIRLPSTGEPEVAEE